MTATELLYAEARDACSGRILIINAAAHPALNALTEQTEHPRNALYLQQHLRPEFLALQNMGWMANPDWPAAGERFDTILLRPAKNKKQTLGWMAEAMLRLPEDGILIMACANAHGARSYESALQKLANAVTSRSKSKCRICTARKTAALDISLAEQWIAESRSRTVPSHGLISQPGLFSWDRPDRGSALLLEHLPPLSGRGMDLGCGYGLISCTVLQHAPEIESLYLVESDYLALDAAMRNSAPWREQIRSRWCDATCEALPESLDWVVCNPPFHSVHQRDVALGQAIIRRACKSLRRGGMLYLVANRQLPYEQLLREELSRCSCLFEGEGFKIFRGER